MQQYCGFHKNAAVLPDSKKFCLLEKSEGTGLGALQGLLFRCWELRLRMFDRCFIRGIVRWCVGSKLVGVGHLLNPNIFRNAKLNIAHLLQ